MRSLLKAFLFSSALFLGLCISSFAGTNNQVQKSELNTSSSVDNELNKPKEIPTLSPDERARIRKALATFAKSSGKESSLIEEKQRELLKSLESRFILCDEDNDNTLDLKETTQCLPQVARQFNRLDFDENGVISLDELAFLAKEFQKNYIEINKLKKNNALSNSKTPPAN